MPFLRFGFQNFEEIPCLTVTLMDYIVWHYAI